MSIVQLPSSSPFRVPMPPVVAEDLASISVEQYHHMVATGSLGPDDKIELLDGILVQKMPTNTDHAVLAETIRDKIESLLPAGWCTRGEKPLSLDTSVPEPDVLIVPGKKTDYFKRHPVASEVAVLIEVSESSLARDRKWKLGIYARNSISAYWIVNLIDRTLEVYTDPTGPCERPSYRSTTVLALSDSVEFVLDGTAIAIIPVADLILDAS